MCYTLIDFEVRHAFLLQEWFQTFRRIIVLSSSCWILRKPSKHLEPLVSTTRWHTPQHLHLLQYLSRSYSSSYCHFEPPKWKRPASWESIPVVSQLVWTRNPWQRDTKAREVKILNWWKVQFICVFARVSQVRLWKKSLSCYVIHVRQGWMILRVPVISSYIVGVNAIL